MGKATAKKNKTRTWEEQLSILRTRLLSKCAFFGYLVLRLKPVPTDAVVLAGVAQDGTLALNTDMFMQLSDEEQMFVLVHEVCHPAFHFWARQKGREHNRWNMAHDYAINEIIETWAGNGGLPCKIIPGSLRDRDYNGMSAEEIYPKIPSPPDGDGPGPDGGGVGRPGKRGGSSGQGGKLAGDCKKTEGAGSGTAEQEMRENARKWKGWLAHASAVQEQVGWGNAPAGIKRLIQEVLQPKLDWWQILSRWLGENGPRRDYSFRRPGRRSESVGEYLPSFVKYGIADVVVLLDTSGSIGDELLRSALGEIAGICEEMALSTRVLVVDAEVHDDVTISNVADLLPHIKGGGGSDYRPAFDVLHKDGFTGVVVAITDGYITVPDQPPANVSATLWILHRGGRKPTTWGDAVHIDREKPEGME